LKTCSKMGSLGIKKVWYNTKNKYWYCLWEGKPKALHRVLMENYVPNPSDLSDVHHIDGDRNNNCLENLSWCTRSDNLLYSYQEHGRKPYWSGKRGGKHPSCMKIVGTDIKDGSKVYYSSLHEAERSGFLKSKISLCINGKRRKHKGYTWEKIE